MARRTAKAQVPRGGPLAIVHGMVSGPSPFLSWDLVLPNHILWQCHLHVALSCRFIELPGDSAVRQPRPLTPLLTLGPAILLLSC